MTGGHVGDRLSAHFFLRSRCHTFCFLDHSFLKSLPNWLLKIQVVAQISPKREVFPHHSIFGSRSSHSHSSLFHSLQNINNQNCSSFVNLVIICPSPPPSPNQKTTFIWSFHCQILEGGGRAFGVPEASQVSWVK